MKSIKTFVAVAALSLVSFRFLRSKRERNRPQPMTAQKRNCRAGRCCLLKIKREGRVHDRRTD